MGNAGIDPTSAGVHRQDLEASMQQRQDGRVKQSKERKAKMTWANGTCDDCDRQTKGGPMLRNEVWATIAKPEAVPVPCDPREPRSKRSCASAASIGASADSSRRKT